MKIDPAIAMLTKDCLTAFRDKTAPAPYFRDAADYIYITPNAYYAVKLDKAHVEINLNRCDQSPKKLETLPWDPDVLCPLTDTGMRKAYTRQARNGKMEKRMGAKLQSPDFTLWLDTEYVKPFSTFYGGDNPLAPVLAITKNDVSAVILPLILNKED
jgi:hypothetical protein